MPNENSEQEQVQQPNEPAFDASQVTETPAPQEPEGPPPNPLLGSLSERGFDTTQFDSDDSLLQAIESTFEKSSQIPQLEQMARYGHEYLQNRDQYQRWMNEQKQQTQQPQEPEEPKGPKWQPPEFDESWMNLIEMDEATGRFRPVSNYVDPSIAEKANNYVKWRREQENKFWEDPYGFINPALESTKEELQQYVAEAIQQAFQGRDSQTKVERYLSERERDFYEYDGETPVIENGYHKLTKKGELFEKYYSEAQSLGIADEYKAMQYAEKLANASLPKEPQEPPSEQQKQPQPPAATNEQQKETFLQKAVKQSQHTPNRNASIASAAEASIAQNPDESFAEMVLREAKEQGIDLSN